MAPTSSTTCGVWQQRMHPTHRRVCDRHVSDHLVRQRQCGPFRLVERVRITERDVGVPHRIHLLESAAGLHANPLVLRPLVFSLIEHADEHDPFSTERLGLHRGGGIRTPHANTAPAPSAQVPAPHRWPTCRNARRWCMNRFRVGDSQLSAPHPSPTPCPSRRAALLSRAATAGGRACARRQASR